MGLKDQSSEVLKLYADGIQKLKDYELHQKLQVDGRKHLIDVYYKEDQMNSFRDSLTRQLERLRLKVENHLAKCGESTGLSATKISFDEKKLQYLQQKLQEEIIDAKEPLILSLLVTVGDELKNFHSMLAKLSECSEEQGGAPQSQ